MQSIEIWQEHVIHLNRDGQILLPNEKHHQDKLKKKKKKRQEIPYPASKRCQQRYEDIEDSLLDDLDDKKPHASMENLAKREEEGIQLRKQAQKQKKQDQVMAKMMASQKRHLQQMVQVFGCRMESPPYVKERKIILMLPKRVNLKLPNMDYVSQASIRWVDKDHLCLQHKVTLRIQIYCISRGSLVKTFEPIVPKRMTDVVQCADQYMVQFDDQTLYGTAFFIEHKRLSTPRPGTPPPLTNTDDHHYHHHHQVHSHHHHHHNYQPIVKRERLYLYSDPQMAGSEASSIHGLSSGFLIAYGDELQFVDICHWNTVCIHDMRYDGDVEKIVTHSDTVVFTASSHRTAVAIMHGPVFSPLSPCALPVTCVDELFLVDDTQLYVMADAGTQFLHVCLNSGTLQHIAMHSAAPCRSLTLAGHFGVFRSRKHTILQAMPRPSSIFYDVHLPLPQRLPNWDDDHATILGYDNHLLLIDQAPLLSVANALPLDDVVVVFSTFTSLAQSLSSPSLPLS